MAEYSMEAGASGTGVSAGPIVNVVGAALSLALIAGVAVWGYKLVQRDVSGIPVVRALEGPMRVAPENPGGEVADHRGLAVNTVAADGAAAPPEDRLMLAPPPVDLEAEDLAVVPGAAAVPAPEAADPQAVEAVSGMIAAASLLGGAGNDAASDADADAGPAADGAAAADPDAPLSQEDILALADRIAAGVTPLSALEAGETPDVVLSIDGTPVRESLSPGVEAIPASVPGVARSLRPQARPMRLSGIEPIAAETALAPAAELDPEAIPAGTALAQLGAFDSAEIARAEWAALSARFGAMMADRPRVVQEAETGGRVFWRLRAGGFEDLADARRFCAALVAEDAVCIPVAVR